MRSSQAAWAGDAVARGHHPPEVGHAQDHRHGGVQLVAGDLDEGLLQSVRLLELRVRVLQLGDQAAALDQEAVMLDRLADAASISSGSQGLPR